MRFSSLFTKGSPRFLAGQTLGLEVRVELYSGIRDRWLLHRIKRWEGFHEREATARVSPKLVFDRKNAANGRILRAAAAPRTAVTPTASRRAGPPTSASPSRP